MDFVYNVSVDLSYRWRFRYSTYLSFFLFLYTDITDTFCLRACVCLYFGRKRGKIQIQKEQNVFMMENVIFQTKSWLHVYSSYGRTPSSLNSFQFSEKREWLPFSDYSYFNTLHSQSQSIKNEPLHQLYLVKLRIRKWMKFFVKAKNVVPQEYYYGLLKKFRENIFPLFRILFFKNFAKQKMH